MPPALQSKTKIDLVVDRSSHTLRFSRDFDAPRSQVFEAWTRPEQVTGWWDAAGQPLVTCEIDLRPGGSFKFVSKGHENFPFSGTYLEISPGRLVFEALGAIGRVLLEEEGGITHMSVEIECRSAEQLEQLLAMGVGAGTSQTLDNLVTYIGRRRLG